MWNHEEIPLLPTTGQSVVRRTGDDGGFRAGRPGGGRLRALGDGTVYDRHTSLVWVQRPELIIPGATGVHASNQAQAARGNWANATAYAAADLAKDTADSTYWVCAVGHTSAAGPTTFAQDRAANPTRWRQTVWTASAANLTTPAAMNWNSAIDACLALSYAGYDDWRLPNWLELATLFDASKAAAPNIDATAFPNTQAAMYWVSTGHGTSEDWAGVASFVNPYPCISVSNKTGTTYVRPVRGGRVNV
jgi:hypothetical protein